MVDEDEEDDAEAEADEDAKCELKADDEEFATEEAARDT